MRQSLREAKSLEAVFQRSGIRHDHIWPRKTLVLRSLWPLTDFTSSCHPFGGPGCLCHDVASMFKVDLRRNLRKKETRFPNNQLSALTGPDVPGPHSHQHQWERQVDGPTACVAYLLGSQQPLMMPFSCHPVWWGVSTLHLFGRMHQLLSNLKTCWTTARMIRYDRYESWVRDEHQLAHWDLHQGSTQSTEFRNRLRVSFVIIYTVYIYISIVSVLSVPGIFRIISLWLFSAQVFHLAWGPVDSQQSLPWLPWPSSQAAGAPCNKRCGSCDIRTAQQDVVLQR